MFKFNKKIILFVAAMVLLLSGISKDFIFAHASAIAHYFTETVSNNKDAASNYKAKIENGFADSITNRDLLLDIDSLKNNVLGNKVYNKGTEQIVVDSNNNLCSIQKEFDPDSLEQSAEQINRIKKISDKYGASFLYCSVPMKGCLESLPANVNDYSKKNTEVFLKYLDANNVPYMDLYDYLVESNSTKNGVFYRTDHHWKTTVAFKATKEICNELNAKYSFEYIDEFLDLNQFDITKYNNSFWGSYGKKVGHYYSWDGLDDFELLTPKFKTDFTVKNTAGKIIKSGDFKQTMLSPDKNFATTYSVYSASYEHFQMIKNNLKSNNKKMLIVRDSMAWVSTPLLALQTDEMYIIDVRDDQGFKDKDVNVEQYIKKLKPDYVLVFYGGAFPVNYFDDRYKFFE